MAYIAAPDPVGDDAPGLLLIHEAGGLNAQIRGMADRFAAEGFLTLAVDLFAGKTTDNIVEARAIMAAMVFTDALATIGQGIAELRARAPRGQLGVTGFCLGGGLALAAAAHFPDDFAACVPFYGTSTPERADFVCIRCPVLGHFARGDQWVPAERVAELEKVPRATVHVYDAKHAFMNEARENYDAVAAALAWDRTIVFLHENLEA